MKCRYRILYRGNTISSITENRRDHILNTETKLANSAVFCTLGKLGLLRIYTKRISQKLSPDISLCIDICCDVCFIWCYFYLGLDKSNVIIYPSCLYIFLNHLQSILFVTYSIENIFGLNYCGTLCFMLQLCCMSKGTIEFGKWNFTIE